MKYIRTKDGCITEGNFEIGKTIATLYGDEQITKENTADTIEELCDEFVLVDENYCHDFYIDSDYDDMIEVYEEEKERCKSPFPYPRKPRMLFGAIWTEKGLIYVAKMNDKGDLELL